MHTTVTLKYQIIKKCYFYSLAMNISIPRSRAKPELLHFNLCTNLMSTSVQNIIKISTGIQIPRVFPNKYKTSAYLFFQTQGSPKCLKSSPKRITQPNTFLQICIWLAIQDHIHVANSNLFPLMKCTIPVHLFHLCVPVKKKRVASADLPQHRWPLFP